MTEQLAQLTVKHYKSDQKPIWCPGCGDFAVLACTHRALTNLQLRPENVVIVSGIGCSSRIPYFCKTYGFHTLHGRTLPVATGVKLVNPDLTVLAMAGDGDLFSIGAGHMPHAAARNVSITCVCMNNQIYGLTKGQTSPTSVKGHTTKSTPYGSISQPMKPVLLALAYGATFVARGYSSKTHQLADLIAQGIKHKGFAFIEVNSPCTEFNNTYDLLDTMVEELPKDWDTRDRAGAMALASTETKVHLGLFYKEERPAYEEMAKAFEKNVNAFDANAYLARFA
ncbi:MAG: 2-oxoacid:ferredoxin oxidoreductase subunit beta [Chloroflexi bacterium]|nr:2-oxoacid:ferredoxin oxidoreductase subunit beta [Chloroflexota bacterium]